MIKANDPTLQSWIEILPDSDFPIQNLPFGIFKTDYLTPVAGVAIGNYVLDLVYLHEHGFFDRLGLPQGIFNQQYLNDFIGLGKKRCREVRERISELLQHDNEELRLNLGGRELALIPLEEVEMCMPVKIPNYTDFYSSEEHATNVGSLFRDPKNALLPNWKHMPVGYHGRASSIVVSGTNIHRPKGQIKLPDSETPIFSASQKLDFELEVAFITCKETELGSSVSTSEAENFIFGFVLFNDWSARDIQQWEYVPLGPFLGKNFGSTISPWIVTMDALEPFRVAGPKQSQEVLPYLKTEGEKTFDINLEVLIHPENSDAEIISKSNFKHLYWNVNQQLAHQTVNGCNLQVGDVYASGTISGPNKDSLGSLLELSLNGKNPITLMDGSTRDFIKDGDTIILKGYASKDNVRIGFGECRGKIVP
jgi:fumarylacetoacetase